MNVKFFTKMREERRPPGFRETSVYAKKRRKRSALLEVGFRRQVVLITGASTGLGLAIAKELMVGPSTKKWTKCRGPSSICKALPCQVGRESDEKLPCRSRGFNCYHEIS